MKTSDIIGSAWHNLGQRRLRTTLAALGVIIGIGAIIGLLALSQGFQDRITGQIGRGFGLDTLVVVPGGFAPGGPSFRLHINDTQTIDAIDGVTLSTGIVTGTGRLSNGENSLLVTVAGINFEEYSTVQSDLFSAESGTIPTDPPADSVVLGYAVAHPRHPDIGEFASVGEQIVMSVVTRQADSIVVKNYSFTVSAVLEEVGEISAANIDNRVFIRSEVATEIFDTREAAVILVVIDDVSVVDEMSDEIEDLFENQVTVISPRGFIELAEPIFRTIDLFLGGIAGIALLVAGIGIMNIMIVSVVERTREIGILKALGATSRTILGMFLSEAILIGVIGGIAGILFGMGLSEVIAQLVSQGFGFQSFAENFGGDFQAPPQLQIAPLFRPETIIGGFLFAVLISTIFGLYPAWRAAKKEPVEALRYE
ncbi:MAG: ABC transporter permease [Candidatus Geothermarchaeales archaeon]